MLLNTLKFFHPPPSPKRRLMKHARRKGVLSGTRKSIVSSLHSLPNSTGKRVLSWNDHCLIVVAVPERKGGMLSANKEKGQTSGTKEGPWDCLWREVKETGVIRRGILGGCLHRISLV
ncbi:hypothetical protein CEXT_679321 [Caerostris extrusa]|uniref:Uncharacterized protein n=1 Tax=Caerostris extrusa TaxID=172846 RepID=A0AAV4SJR6_CAEEX|nr:hypothetical protein CEXT_679321 [Caerostris extrusa]